MDVLSSQSNLAGYKAVLAAADTYGRAFPMMMTAAGTVNAAKCFVMGVGVAGLQAIATARRLGAQVSATDVRPAVKEQVQSLGGSFIAVEDEEFKVACTQLEHRVPAFGYRIDEKDRLGRFDVKRAKAMGILPGPIYGKLKNGEVVTLPDGRRINGKELCGPTLPGRSLAYCTDTVFCDQAVELAQGVDILIHEATFAHQDAEMAYQRLHSTSTMAAQTALLAGAKQLIMTHFSPRYAPGNAIQLSDLLAEAQAIFPNTVMAQDFDTYAIERREPASLVAS